MLIDVDISTNPKRKMWRKRVFIVNENIWDAETVSQLKANDTCKSHQKESTAVQLLPVYAKKKSLDFSLSVYFSIPLILLAYRLKTKSSIILQGSVAKCYKYGSAVSLLGELITRKSIDWILKNSTQSARITSNYQQEFWVLRHCELNCC
ncbi:hypothetical protein BY458DRAFT_495327 [Sporodiniella umbellata]|nr:hypothetical protein BY458DRAFT_495327 [Sporodiniella umbellata]